MRVKSFFAAAPVFLLASFLLASFLLASLLQASCGYHTAGQAGLLPKTIVTIGVPAFTNGTTRYKLSDWLPEEISKEFIASSRYRVVEASHADAVLKGSILGYNSSTALFDQKTALATSVEIHVALQVSLVERTTGKVLFSRPRIEITDNYEIPLQEGQYFDESDSALQRVSKRVAQQVVSAILNDF
jgi:lipopolysaccharide assembly LptE-like protein